MFSYRSLIVKPFMILALIAAMGIFSPEPVQAHGRHDRGYHHVFNNFIFNRGFVNRSHVRRGFGPRNFHPYRARPYVRYLGPRRFGRRMNRNRWNAFGRQPVSAYRGSGFSIWLH